MSTAPILQNFDKNIQYYLLQTNKIIFWGRIHFEDIIDLEYNIKIVFVGVRIYLKGTVNLSPGCVMNMIDKYNK